MFEFLGSEAGVRLICFAVVLTLMAVWESLAPRRAIQIGRQIHWTNNIGLALLNTLALRLIVPIGAIGFAIFVESNNWGLFNLWPVPNWLSILICVIFLDLVVYGQHVLFHAIPLLWRLHMVHHADMEFDVTTGLRFHTIEIILSMGFKCAAIIVLGAPFLSVLIFEVLLNATSMFNHSNVWMPAAVDRTLRWFLVTPDMHRIHHSTVPTETNSNFGFNVPWWDRLLGTYCHEPIHGQSEMMIGLEQFRDPRRLTLIGIILLPFLGTPGRYPLLRKDKDARP